MLKNKSRKIIALVICSITGLTNAYGQLIFKSGFESLVQKVNDSGITSSGNSTTGNTPDCSFSDISAPQDCDEGRDNSLNDDIDGHAGFSFTKLDANGNTLPNSAIDWICVKDNHTGLIWEVKTTGTGVHNKDNRYAWGGITAIGLGHPDAQGDYSSFSWNDLVNESNDNVFCGYNDWRVPTLNELLSIVNFEANNPVIDTNFFPRTVVDEYWTASPIAFNDLVAWYVGFEFGFSYREQRGVANRVRIVRKDR